MYEAHSCDACHLTSLWSAERDWLTAGPVALLVENVDGESVLGERLESRHDGASPLSRKRHGPTLVQNLFGIQQTPLPQPVNL